MIELLLKLPDMKNKQEKQLLYAQIIAKLPEFITELGEVEQKYYRGLQACIQSEGSKSGGEALMQATDVHKEYRAKKRLYDAIMSALPVLGMY